MAKTFIPWGVVYRGKDVPQPRRLFAARVVPGRANSAPSSGVPRPSLKGALDSAAPYPPGRGVDHKGMVVMTE